MAPKTLPPAPPSTTCHSNTATLSSGPSSTTHHIPRALLYSTSPDSIPTNLPSGTPWNASSSVPQTLPPLSSLLTASDYPPIADSRLPKRGHSTIAKKIGPLSTPASSNFHPPSSLSITSTESLQVLSVQSHLKQRVSSALTHSSILPPLSSAAESDSPPFPPLHSALFKSMVGLDSVHPVISPFVSPRGKSGIANLEIASAIHYAQSNLVGFTTENGVPKNELWSSEILE